MKRWWAPIILILIVNGLALFSAARNRSDVRREIELSELELSVHGESRNRSTIMLHLIHSQLPIAAQRESGRLARRGFAVLEFDGPALRKLHRTEKAISRLVVIDYADKAQDLEARYPDRNRYLIVHGRAYSSSDGKQQYIWPDVLNIEVPKQLRHVFADSANRRHFLAKLRFGRNYEPWLESAHRVDSVE